MKIYVFLVFAAVGLIAQPALANYPCPGGPGPGEQQIGVGGGSFLCVWQPVEGLMVVALIALGVGMRAAIDVTVAIFLPIPAHPVTTP